MTAVKAQRAEMCENGSGTALLEEDGHEPEHDRSPSSPWSLARAAMTFLTSKRTQPARKWQSQRHRWSRRSEIPGLEISFLVDIFGDGARKLDLDKIRIAASGRVLLGDYACMKWNKENMDKMIRTFEGGVICCKGRSEKTFLHHSIIAGALDCAEVLFDYAATEDIVVDLSWKDGNILEWSIDSYSREAVQFVLERITSRCASAKETIQVTTEHLQKLLDSFPAVVESFIIDNRLCFECGRFQVPKSIFKGTDERPIGMIVDNELEDPKWEADSEAVQALWENYCPELKAKLNHEDEEQVTAVSKFACVEDLAVDCEKRSIAATVETRCSMDVFTSEAVRANVQWKWHTHLRHKFIFSNTMYLVSVLFFFIFISFYGNIQGSSDVWLGSAGSHISADAELWVARASMVCSCCFLVFPLLIRPASYIWLFFSGIETGVFLLVHVFVKDRHTWLSAVVVSIHCLIILFKTLQYLRPFRWFGPFVAMTYYVLRDIMPFMCMGAIVVVDFGFGLFVLLGWSFQRHDSRELGEEERDLDNETASQYEDMQKEIAEDRVKVYMTSFKTIWRVFEYLLYAIVGQFEPGVFHLADNRFLCAWISVFFSVFLLLAAIVLLSLLISVLGNTFDRVVLHEEAEFIKHRAHCIATFDRINLGWKALGSRIAAKLSCRKPTDSKFRYSGSWLTPVKNMSVFHYLVPAEEAVALDDSAWHGRLHAVIKSTRDSIESLNKKEDGQRKSLRKEIDALTKQTDDLHKKLDELATSVNRGMHELLNRLPAGNQRENQ